MLSEALTLRSLDVLKDSVSQEVWFPGSVEVVEEDDSVPFKRAFLGNVKWNVRT